MVGKERRQEEVRRVVRSHRVSTQGQLASLLEAAGIEARQAMLSRDLAELGVRKSGGRYVLDDRDATDGRTADLSAAVRRYLTCGPHLIVIKTAVGLAQPIAVTVDNKNDPAIAGTLAGDDTVFVATRNQRSQTVALRRLEQWFGDKYER